MLLKHYLLQFRRPSERLPFKFQGEVKCQALLLLQLPATHVIKISMGVPTRASLVQGLL